MSIVNDFISRYLRELDYYREAARICAQICEVELEQNGIRGIVTYRVKRSDRVKKKIEIRNRIKEYSNTEEIYQDIVDLSGVRIAVYFPNDIDEVDRLINSRFEVLSSKEFPQELNSNNETSSKNLQRGYHATHYRLRLKRNDLSDTQLKYYNAQIEVQVASVLMHAWAEIEHDLTYKPVRIQPSEEELEILDELHGIVILGEKTLKRLQTEMKRRVTSERFKNHYELAAFLHSEIQRLNGGNVFEPIMGRADILFRFLELQELNTGESLRDVIQILNPKIPIVEQVVDYFIVGSEEQYNIYMKSKREVGIRTPYDYPEETIIPQSDSRAQRLFFSRWIAFEMILQKHHTNKHILLSNEVFLSLIEKLSLSASELIEIEKIRDLRNELVHGVGISLRKDLLHGGEYLDKVINGIKSQIPKEIKRKIDKVLQGNNEPIFQC